MRELTKKEHDEMFAQIKALEGNLVRMIKTNDASEAATHYDWACKRLEIIATIAAKRFGG